MKKEEVLKAIKEARKQNKKRNFTQTAELIVALKDLDLKKPENQVELYVTLPEGLGKEIKIAGIVSPDMLEEAKKHFDLVLVEEDLEKYRKNKRLGKKLARSYDYFVASAPLMPKIAAAIGRYDRLTYGVVSQIGGSGNESGKTGQGSVSLPYTPLWLGL